MEQHHLIGAQGNIWVVKDHCFEIKDCLFCFCALSTRQTHGITFPHRCVQESSPISSISWFLGKLQAGFFSVVVKSNAQACHVLIIPNFSEARTAAQDFWPNTIFPATSSKSLSDQTQYTKHILVQEKLRFLQKQSTLWQDQELLFGFCCKIRSTLPHLPSKLPFCCWALLKDCFQDPSQPLSTVVPSGVRVDGFKKFQKQFGKMASVI